MSLAPFVRIVARGKGRARPLTTAEATEAMTLMLEGHAAPEAIGAIFMVLRLRGETAEEIAGFTAALRQHVQYTVPKADLDWPVYAAGRTRGAPLFLLAARLVTHAGFAVSMHGWNSHQATAVSVRDALALTGPMVRYHRLEDLSETAFNLLRLRDVLGLRSCMNTVLRMWNPSGAQCSVQGVFHPSYRALQTAAAAQLGQTNLTVIKGGGGEFERNPAKAVPLFGLRDGVCVDDVAPALIRETRRLHEVSQVPDLSALWYGRSHDPFAIATVTGTAALALWSLKAAPTLRDARRLAADLWERRHEKESLSA